jgi:hypothetical protein
MQLVLVVSIFVSPDCDFIVSARIQVSKTHWVHALLGASSEISNVYRILKPFIWQVLNDWLHQWAQML